MASRLNVSLTLTIFVLLTDYFTCSAHLIAANIRGCLIVLLRVWPFYTISSHPIADGSMLLAPRSDVITLRHAPSRATGHRT